MAFLEEFRKFLGGVAGDERTNAGIAINKSDPTEAAKRSWRAVPFSYRSTGKNGYPKMRTGFLKVPFYADADRNDDLLKQDNSEAIALLGIELDDGTQLNYNQSKDFLNSFTPDSIKFTIDDEDIDSPEQDAISNGTGLDPIYPKNLRKRIKYVANNAPGEYALPDIPSTSYIKNTPTSKFIEALRQGRGK
jgi:hypothetical protein